MKQKVPLLSPLLRSDTQGRMLAALYLHPERERTLTELAEVAGVSAPTISRDIERLTTSGFLNARVSGRNRYIRVDTQHPLFSPVADVLRYSYGPIALLPDILSALKGIEQAFIYGSWAMRYQGELGSDPNDIDVLVIGDVDRSDVYEAASIATATLGRETNIRSVTRDAWTASNDLFLRTVRERALIEIPLEVPS
jgi:DNA-binding transcriptional ArsR family regulator